MEISTAISKLIKLPASKAASISLYTNNGTPTYTTPLPKRSLQILWLENTKQSKLNKFICVCVSEIIKRNSLTAVTL